MSVFFHNPKTGTEQAAFQMRVTSNIEKAEALLRGIPGGAETALDKAILKARREHSKLAEEAILQKYNITSKALHKKDGGKSRIKPTFKKVVSASGHGFINGIFYRGYLIPLSEFGRSLHDQREGKSRPIYKKKWVGHQSGLYHFQSSISPKIHVLKEGRAEQVKRAFVARVHAGATDFHTGIFERKEKRAEMITVQDKGKTIRAINGDSTIEQKYSPSVEQMLSREDLRDIIDAKMNERIDDDLDRMIGRILEGKISV